MLESHTMPVSVLKEMHFLIRIHETAMLVKTALM